MCPSELSSPLGWPLSSPSELDWKSARSWECVSVLVYPSGSASELNCGLACR